MEPPKEEIVKYVGPRYKLIGPKVQVVEIERGELGMRIHMRYGPVIMAWDVQKLRTNLRVGEWITLYAEIPLDAEPEPTSIQ